MAPGAASTVLIGPQEADVVNAALPRAFLARRARGELATDQLLNAVFLRRGGVELDAEGLLNAVLHRPGPRAGSGPWGLTSGRVLIAGRDAQILGWLTAPVDDVASRHGSIHYQHPRYRAPELNDATEGPSREADVYALGCLLVEAAVGQGYYGGPSEALEAARETLEPAFIGILRACLHDDPARRPPALQLRQTLDPLASRETGDPFTIALGCDAEPNSVRLDLRGESSSGDGPHLLCQGVRRGYTETCCWACWSRSRIRRATGCNSSSPTTTTAAVSTGSLGIHATSPSSAFAEVERAS